MSVTEASGWADSPQLSRLRSVSMTRQDCSAFSVIFWYTRDFMVEVSCPRSARPSGKISIAEKYNVFGAKLTRQNHMKKKNLYIFMHSQANKILEVH